MSEPAGARDASRMHPASEQVIPIPAEAQRAYDRTRRLDAAWRVAYPLLVSALTAAAAALAWWLIDPTGGLAFFAKAFGAKAPSGAGDLVGLRVLASMAAALAVLMAFFNYMSESASTGRSNLIADRARAGETAFAEAVNAELAAQGIRTCQPFGAPLWPYLAHDSELRLDGVQDGRHVAVRLVRSPGGHQWSIGVRSGHGSPLHIR